MNKQKILIIDSDPSILSTLVGFLNDEPYDVRTTSNGIEGLEILRRKKIDLTIAEMYMEGLDGVTLLRCLKEDKIQTNVLIMESVLSLEVIEKILKVGAVGVLDKPIVKDKFLAKIKNCILLNEVGYKVSQVRETPPLQPKFFQQQLNTGREKVSQEALESFLEAHYKKPDLKFEDLARHFRITSPHGHVLFRKFFNKTFSEKLREVRIAQAEHFLTGSSLFMYEIAPLCGFHSPSRFCHAFKRIHGISPTQYRKKVRYGEI